MDAANHGKLKPKPKLRRQPIAKLHEDSGYNFFSFCDSKGQRLRLIAEDEIGSLRCNLCQCEVFKKRTGKNYNMWFSIREQRHLLSAQHQQEVLLSQLSGEK